MKQDAWPDGLDPVGACVPFHYIFKCQSGLTIPDIPLDYHAAMLNYGKEPELPLLKANIFWNPLRRWFNLNKT